MNISTIYASINRFWPYVITGSLVIFYEDDILPFHLGSLNILQFFTDTLGQLFLGDIFWLQPLGLGSLATNFKEGAFLTRGGTGQI